ncbi:MAG: hypothetical protein KDB14_04905 [Planctomycetales bacterium]|nr:hypothetical protein [Planctomycetales bacterium]
MKMSLKSAWTVATAFAIIGVLGCGGESPPQPTQPSNASTEAEHGHDHGPGGHDHGEGGHGHAAGPHGGTVADWGGGKYHVEFTVDHGKQEATVYILGSDEKSPEPIAAESVLLTIKDPQLQADLLPAPLEGEGEGKASRFVGQHEGLATVKEYEGTISGVIGETPYAGNFKEEAAGHGHAHGHSHGEDDALVWEGEPRQHAGLVIKLGHHGKHLHAGEEVEPAVSITRNGEPVADAKVFNALVSADGATVLAKEVPTVYEPTTSEEPAHYAQGGLMIPQEAKSLLIRFRIVPADGEEATFDVPVSVE